MRLAKPILRRLLKRQEKVPYVAPGKPKQTLENRRYHVLTAWSMSVMAMFQQLSMNFSRLLAEASGPLDF